MAVKQGHMFVGTNPRMGNLYLIPVKVNEANETDSFFDPLVFCALRFFFKNLGISVWDQVFEVFGLEKEPEESFWVFATMRLF